MDFLGRLRAFVIDQDLVRSGDRLVLGVSGGPDSLCMLEALSGLAPEWGLALHVAYLDHGLRPEAAAEADFVRAAAVARGWPFHTARVDTRAHAAARRLSLEEAARALRYAFLAETAAGCGAARVAVAHNADDQAETVLMHFLRGTGLAGLRGMQPLTRLPGTALWLVRPLLATPRAEVEAFCAVRGLEPRQDATNLDTTLFRNRLRHELLPRLATYNPNIRAVLQRTAVVAAGEYALLEPALDALWRRLASVDNGQVVFDRAGWVDLKVGQQRALLRRAAQQLLPDERNVDFTPLEQAVQFSRRAAPGRACDLLRGLRLTVMRDTLVVSAWRHRPARPDQPWLAGGALAASWHFSVELLPAGAWSLAEVVENVDPWRADADADRLPFSEWRLRVRWAGARFQPLGLGGHQVKLSDFLINQRVARELRDVWPLVVRADPAGADDALVWVAGLRLDERYRVTAATQQVARLRFTRRAAEPEPEAR